jgi:hypothetical protein
MTVEASLSMQDGQFDPVAPPSLGIPATLPKELRHTCVQPSFKMVGYCTQAPMYHLFQCVCGIGEIMLCAKLMGGHEKCKVCETATNG